MSEELEKKVTFLNIDLKEIGGETVKGDKRIKAPGKTRFMHVEAKEGDIRIVEQYMFGTRNELLVVVRGIGNQQRINAQNPSDALKAAEAALIISDPSGIFRINLVTFEVRKLVAKTKGQAQAEASPLPANSPSDPAQSAASGSHSGFRAIGKDDWEGDDEEATTFYDPNAKTG